MTRKEKELLLKDLCARLPYKVIIKSVGENKIIGLWDLRDIDNLPLPYLRPLSSMTEKEKETYHNLCYEEEKEEYKFGEWVTRVYYHDTIDSIDYLNLIHIDYRDLIPKGFAIEVTESNNPYKD